MGPPPELVERLVQLFGFKSFVETGTFHGHTTAWASERFDQVVTIEAADLFYRAASDRFHGSSIVKTMHGDAGAVLAPLLPNLPPSIFFLDAHWSGGETAGAKAECPLLSELHLIKPWFRKHAVLIDDARLFLAPPPAPHDATQWPSIDEIANVMDGGAYMCLYRDVIVMVPNVYRKDVSSLISHLMSNG